MDLEKRHKLQLTATNGSLIKTIRRFCVELMWCPLTESSNKQKNRNQTSAREKTKYLLKANYKSFVFNKKSSSNDVLFRGKYRS